MTGGSGAAGATCSIWSSATTSTRRCASSRASRQTNSGRRSSPTISITPRLGPCRLGIVDQAVDLRSVVAARRGDGSRHDLGSDQVVLDRGPLHGEHPLTVVIHMKTPSRVDLVASSEDGAWIVCPSAIAAEAKDTNYFESGKDCGTGPYTLASYKPGQQVVLKAYPRYWRGWTANRYQNVVGEITPEAIVEQQMLTSGQVDLALSVPAENSKQLEVLADAHLRGREQVGDALRSADQGRVREDRRQGDVEADPVQPAVGARQGEPEEGSGHLPASVLADLQRRRGPIPLSTRSPDLTSIRAIPRPCMAYGMAYGEDDPLLARAASARAS